MKYMVTVTLKNGNKQIFWGDILDVIFDTVDQLYGRDVAKYEAVCLGEGASVHPVCD